jgi:hypothetical protein
VSAAGLDAIKLSSYFFASLAMLLLCVNTFSAYRMGILASFRLCLHHGDNNVAMVTNHVFCAWST